MPNARTTDPTTSHEAAARVRNVTEQQRAILNILAVPMTDEELVARYENIMTAGLAPMASPSGIRSRRSELVYLHLVTDSKDRRKLRTGRNAIVWRTTELGIEELNG
jgi:hypothetical protein